MTTLPTLSSKSGADLAPSNSAPICRLSLISRFFRASSKAGRMRWKCERVEGDRERRRIGPVFKTSYDKANRTSAPARAASGCGGGGVFGGNPRDRWACPCSPTCMRLGNASGG